MAEKLQIKAVDMVRRIRDEQHKCLQGNLKPSLLISLQRLEKPSARMQNGDKRHKHSRNKTVNNGMKAEGLDMAVFLPFIEVTSMVAYRLSSF